MSCVRNALCACQNMISEYDPTTLIYKLQTYSLHESSSKDRKEITTERDLRPCDIKSRIDVLAELDFKTTEYKFRCERQRKRLTPKIRQEVILRDASICQNCGKHCAETEIEIDHIKPVSRGGQTVLNNLQVLCKSCNAQKSNKWSTNVFIDIDY